MSDPSSPIDALRERMAKALQEHAHSGSVTVEHSGGYLFHTACRCGWHSPNRYTFGEANDGWHQHQADAVLDALGLAERCAVCGLDRDGCTGEDPSDWSDWAHTYSPLVFATAHLSPGKETG